jgi:hypothetical protein
MADADGALPIAAENPMTEYPRATSRQRRPWLFALGPQDPPERFSLHGEDFRRLTVFKHDFFAATTLYEGAGAKVVLKIGRTYPLFGLPMEWIGRILCFHECRLFSLVRDIDGIPKLTGRVGPTGLVHEFAEGRPLAKGDVVADDFFPRLESMLAAIHRRQAAYVDFEKRENILHGADGRPWLIDFQISWHVPDARGGRCWPARRWLAVLQAADRYHLLKHWRRLRPDQLDTRELDESHFAPTWIRWHRAIFRPLTMMRRRLLVRLGARTSAKLRSPG